ncbi:MAG: metal-dependent transcriptional regulator [Longimicrobiales bacterium]
MNSIRAEDYLKTIYELEQAGGPAPTSAIAARLEVSAGTVTGMVKRLSDRGLVEHVPYNGARLTRAGETAALGLIRRHRLVELFLVRRLGYGWDRVHAEAERLEHAVSDELVDRMAAILGEPERDPHGARIPKPGEPFEDPCHPCLSELAEGTRAVLREVPDEDPEALRYLARQSLVPGVEIRLLERTPFRGPLRIEVGQRECYVGVELSAHLRVEPMPVAKAPVRDVEEAE